MLRDHRRSGENERYIRCHCSPRVVPALKRSGDHCRNKKVITSCLRNSPFPRAIVIPDIYYKKGDGDWSQSWGDGDDNGDEQDGGGDDDEGDGDDHKRGFPRTYSRLVFTSEIGISINRIAPW